MARRIAILGGGVAGLATAYAVARRGADVTVFEADGRPGGTIRTLRAHGCVVDTGPEAIVATRPETIAMCEDLGLGDSMVAPDDAGAATWLATRGHLSPLPEGIAAGVPRSLTELATTPLLSWGGKLRASLDLVLPAGKRESALGRIIERRLGSEVKERLVEPIFGGIYASDVDTLDAPFVAPQLANARRSLIRVVAGQRRATGSPLRAPIDGMQSIVDALVARIGRERLRTGHAARRVERTEHGWTVEATGCDAMTADDVIIAMPPEPATAVLRPLDPLLADAVSTLRAHSTASVILAFDGADAEMLPRVGGFFAPRDHAGALLAVTIASNRWTASAPDGTVLVRALIGGARAPDLVETADDEQLVLATLTSLDALFPLPDPKWTHVTRFVRSQVFPSVGHRSRVALARARASALGSLHFVGASYDGGGIAGILARAEQTARELCS